MILYLLFKILLLISFSTLIFLIYIGIQFALIPYRVNKIMQKNN